MKSKGRPKIQIPESIVKEIIYQYSKERNITGKIKYMDVFRFSTELFEKKEIQYNISEFFWRKGDGKVLIDKANQIFTHSLPSNENFDEIVIDTEDAVNKFFNGNKQDKYKLIGSLKMNEQKLKHYIKQYVRCDKQLAESKEEVKILKENIKDLNQKVTAYENQLFQWLELSNNKNIPLINLLTTGSTRSSHVEELLKSIFSNNPLEVFSKIELLNGSLHTKDTIDKESSVTSINKYKEKSVSVLDDFDL